MKIILIGGTPGTGKTSAAQALGQKLKRDVKNLGQIAIDGGCLKDRDEERDTHIIDEDCLVDTIDELIDETDSDLIIEGHYIDLVPGRPVQRVFILRVHPEILLKRLNERNYSKDKIEENVESEIFGVCQMDAIDAFGEGKVYEIDTSDLSTDQIVEEIERLLAVKETPKRFDWMVMLEEEGILDEFLHDE